MDILRFITAGNVDDGKSTLIGRLLYDTKNIETDILESVHTVNQTGPNLAHITDGLRSERQQGITIDVAYKYFTTAKRKFIITDAPGHFQYTKNLVTGASNTDLIIILIDACNGITDQTRRHSQVASFLRIPNVIVAVNKMDSVNYSEAVFNTIKSEFLTIAALLNLPHLQFIPISALHGENVTTGSENMSWYSGKHLLAELEGAQPVHVNSNKNRCTIQYTSDSVIEHFGFGKIVSGSFNINDEVTIWPEQGRSRITKIISNGIEVSRAIAGENITICLAENQTVKRGDLVTKGVETPNCANSITAALCWLDDTAPLQLNNYYILRVNAYEVLCKVDEVLHKTDVKNFEKYNDAQPLEVNTFALVKIETVSPIAFDLFSDLPSTGRGILIDLTSNNTCGAFTIESE